MLVPHIAEQLIDVAYYYHDLQQQVKQAALAQTSYALAGRLIGSSSGWLLLEVPNAVVQGLFDALDEPGVELPYHSDHKLRAHISVMNEKEVASIGGLDKISERGHNFAYSLAGFKTVVPASWQDVALVYLVEVKSPALQELRKSYGLSPIPDHNRKPFHITVACRRKNILRDNALSKASSESKTKIPTIAVDLDGTLCDYDHWRGEDHFGTLRPGAKEALQELDKLGHKIIIWTTRGNHTNVADFLKKQEVPYHHINDNPDQPPHTSKKVIADLYVDDRAIDGSQEWPEIVKQIKERLGKTEKQALHPKEGFHWQPELMRSEFINPSVVKPQGSEYIPDVYQALQELGWQLQPYQQKQAMIEKQAVGSNTRTLTRILENHPEFVNVPKEVLPKLINQVLTGQKNPLASRYPYQQPFAQLPQAIQEVQESLLAKNYRSGVNFTNKFIGTPATSKINTARQDLLQRLNLAQQTKDIATFTSGRHQPNVLPLQQLVQELPDAIGKTLAYRGYQTPQPFQQGPGVFISGHPQVAANYALTKQHIAPTLPTYLAQIKTPELQSVGPFTESMHQSYHMPGLISGRMAELSRIAALADNPKEVFTKLVNTILKPEITTPPPLAHLPQYEAMATTAQNRLPINKLFKLLPGTQLVQQVK